MQFILDPHTGRLFAPGASSLQHAWKHGAGLPILLTAVPLAVRRRYPLSAFAVVLLGAVAIPRYATDVTFLAIVFAGYSAVAYSRFRGAALLSMLPAGLLVAVSYWKATPANLAAQPRAGDAGASRPLPPGAGVTVQPSAPWRLAGLVAAFSLVMIAVDR